MLEQTVADAVWERYLEAIKKPTVFEYIDHMTPILIQHDISNDDLYEIIWQRTQGAH